MISETQNLGKNAYSHTVIIGESIQEIIDYVIPKIRRKSQKFYSSDIEKDLNEKGKSIVDIHAGNGCFYEIFLKPLN